MLSRHSELERCCGSVSMLRVLDLVMTPWLWPQPFVDARQLPKTRVTWSPSRVAEVLIMVSVMSGWEEVVLQCAIVVAPPDMVESSFLPK